MLWTLLTACFFKNNFEELTSNNIPSSLSFLNCPQGSVVQQQKVLDELDVWSYVDDLATDRKLTQCVLKSNPKQINGAHLLVQKSEERIIKQVSFFQNGTRTKFPFMTIKKKSQKEIEYWSGMLSVGKQLIHQDTAIIDTDTLKPLILDLFHQIEARSSTSPLSDEERKDMSLLKLDFVQHIIEKSLQEPNNKSILNDADSVLKTIQPTENSKEPFSLSDEESNRFTMLQQTLQSLQKTQVATMPETKMFNEQTIFLSASAYTTIVQEKDSNKLLSISTKDLYVDATPVVQQDVQYCMDDCQCPAGAWNSWPVAKAYCESIDKRLLFEEELMALQQNEAARSMLSSSEWAMSMNSLSSPYMLEHDPKQEYSPIVIRQKKDAYSRDRVHLNEREAASQEEEHAFRCVSYEPPASFPKPLSKPLSIPNWNSMIEKGSLGDRFKEYIERVQKREEGSHVVDITKLEYNYLDIGFVSDYIWKYHQEYPDITQVYHLGYSRDHFPLLALRITDNPTVDENGEPAIFINGAHHGDEQLSVLYAFQNIQQVLKQHQKTPKKSWVNQFDFWFIPLVNPDGNWMTMRKNKKYNVGRKNGRNTDKNCSTDGAKEGVDLNRNYPFCFGCLGERGSKSKKTTFYYRGEKPASEPESKAIIQLANHYHFVSAISWHTNGSMVITPYTIEGNQSPNAPVNIYDEEETGIVPNIAWKLAEQIVDQIPVQPGNKFFTVKSNMYPVDGTDQDWHFHEHGTLAYIIEGSHHNPISSRIRKGSITGVKNVLPEIMRALQQDYFVSGRIEDEEGNPLEATVRVQEHDFFENENWTSRPHDGYFYRLLIRKQAYHIYVDKEGYERKKVRITRRNRKNLVVQLKRKKSK